MKRRASLRSPAHAMALLLASVLSLAACDGETASGSTAGASAADVTEMCRGVCSRQQRCDGETTSTCASACEEEFRRAAPHLRADLLQALGTCHDELQCDTSDDTCIETALNSAGISIDEDNPPADVKSCVDKQDECAGTEHQFIDDECSTLLFMTSSSRPKAAACYQKPCDQVRDCIAPYGVNGSESD